MTRPRAPLWMAVLLLSFLAPARAVTQPVALVADLQGTVQWSQDGGRSWQPAALMTLLPPGALVRATGRGQATLSFLRSPLRARLTAPGTVRVEAGQVDLVQGPASALSTRRPGAQGMALTPAGANLARMGGGLRTSEAPEELLLTCDPVVADGRPLLRWFARGQWTGFELLVDEKPSATSGWAFQGTAPGPARCAELPAEVSLLPGSVYTILVTALRPDGTRKTAEQEIRVLDPATAERLIQARRQAQSQVQAAPEDLSPLVELLSLYVEANLHTPALELAQDLLRQRPDDPALRQVAATVYRWRKEEGPGQP